jgi:diguanylate cyclase (GGDEF)-like protein
MLTGLPNRARYREMLARALARPVAQRGTVTVVSVAIDRFDHINDALGRATGDALLRCAGDRLVACVGPMDAVARLEEATFGLIVVTERATPVDLDALALAIREALRAPLNAHGFVVAVTASVGIAEAPERAPDADVLMTFTDRAVRESRTGGGNTARVYEPAMDPKSAQALTLEHALRTALANEEFVLHYQPKLRIDTGDWSGAEALLRWNSPHSGLLPPATFIPALESTGLIVPVGTWVIESACRQIGEWERSGIGSICVSVNVSSRQFLRDDFVAIVTAAIRANDIAPELLEIEITESSLMSRSAAADTTLAELKALGVSISIDDFGTGYSSLAYLKRFPIDTLKIDISFIRDVTTSVEGAAIAKAIIEMARSLKMTVIAEGVETQPQLDWLRQHACDEIQGFLYSRPLCADDLALLRRNHLALAVA